MFNPSRALFIGPSVNEAITKAQEMADCLQIPLVVMARHAGYYPTQNAMIYKDTPEQNIPAKLGEWSHWATITPSTI